MTLLTDEFVITKEPDGPLFMFKSIPYRFPPPSNPIQIPAHVPAAAEIVWLDVAGFEYVQVVPSVPD